MLGSEVREVPSTILRNAVESHANTIADKSRQGFGVGRQTGEL